MVILTGCRVTRSADNTQAREAAVRQGIRLAVDLGVYSMDTIQRAAYQFSNRYSVEIRQRSGKVTVVLKPMDSKQSLATAEMEFRNALNDFSIRIRVAEETKEIREAIVRTALGEALGRK